MDILTSQQRCELDMLRDIKDILMKMDFLKVTDTGALTSDQLYPNSPSYHKKRRKIQRAASMFSRTQRRPDEMETGHNKIDQISTTPQFSVSTAKRSLGERKQTKRQRFHREDTTRYSLTTHTGTRSSSTNSTPRRTAGANMDLTVTTPRKPNHSHKHKSKRINQSQRRISEPESGFHSEELPSPNSLDTFEDQNPPEFPTPSPSGHDIMENRSSLCKTDPTLQPLTLLEFNEHQESTLATPIPKPRQSCSKQNYDYANLNFYETRVSQTLRSELNAKHLSTNADVTDTHDHCDTASKNCDVNELIQAGSLYSCSNTSPLYFSKQKTRSRVFRAKVC